MPVEYLPDGTTVHSESLPPKANGIGWNTVLAAVTAGAVLAGAAFGLSELFDGADIPAVDGATMGARLNGDGAIMQGVKGAGRDIQGFGNDIAQGAQEFGNDIAQKAGETAKGVVETGKQLTEGINEGITGAFGGSSEFSKTLQGLTLPVNPYDPAIEAFKNSNLTFQELPTGDILVRPHADAAEIFRFDDVRIRELQPAQLEKFPLLKQLHEAVVEKPIDIDWAKGGAMMAAGGAAGLGVATLAANNNALPANPNPYSQVAQTGGRTSPSNAMLTQAMHQGQLTQPHLTRLM